MTSRVFVRPQAQAEIEAARRWYERESPGLGSRFVSAVDDALGSLADRPLAFPCVNHDVRRALLKRFPYAVFFRSRASEIIVVAVIHGRRDPGRWRSRR